MLRARGGVWYADIRIRGKRTVKSCFTSNIDLAQEYHDTLKATLYRSRMLQQHDSLKWDDAVKLWLREKSHKASLQDDIEKFDWLRPILSGKVLSDIDRQLLVTILNRKSAHAAGGTVNRLLALIRAVLRLAQAHEMVATIPSFLGLARQENQERIAYLTEKQADELLLALPLHLKTIFSFALGTGLRQNNVIGLEWTRVDLKRRCAWVDAANSKSKKAIGIPLNDAAYRVLAIQMAERKYGDKYVFVDYKTKPFEATELRSALNKALRVTGIGAQIYEQFGVKFRWHDLRHTWATWHVMNGTPLDVLQKLGGWSSIDMVQKYAHFSPEHLAKHANNIGRVRKYA